jgi:glycosyltransferase involved in cell wall biosynthesis
MYPPHHLGGYELTWRASVAHLRSLGHAVRVLTTDYRKPEVDDSAAEDPDVHRELRWYWRDHAWPRLSIRERLSLERSNAHTFDRHVAEFGPDVVNWWAMGGMSLSLIERARRRGLPGVGVVGDNWMLYGPRVDAWFRVVSRPPLRPLGPLVERITGVPARVRLRGTTWLFNSDFMRQQALDHWELPGAEVAHPGVPESLFAPAPRPPWRWRLAYVGRIDERKGIDWAIDALCLLPAEATLAVVGSGDEEHLRALRELAVDRGLEGRVSFGERPRHELRAEYAAADVLVFPVRWHEPWGLVPLEAMAVGTPVVATGTGGSGEYLRHEENCLVFDPADGAAGLAGAVRRLAAEPALRARLREAGLVTAARFSEGAYNERIAAALVSARRPPA